MAGQREVHMVDKLEIHHFRTLNALLTTGKISSAAEQLNVSQQAVSLQLKKIRTIVGDPLFVRTGHGMAPTSYAKVIEPHIHQILSHISTLPLPDAIRPDSIERKLVISATDYAQEVIIGPLVKELRQSAPNVRVMVINIENVNLIQKMNQGDIDLTLTTRGYVPDGLVFESLFSEHYLCVAAHNTIVVEEYLPLKKLADYDFVIVSPGTGSFIGSADDWFERQGVRRRVAVSAPSFYMMQEYLKHSDMVGLMPSRLLPCNGLTEIPLEKDPPGYEVVAAYHPTANNDPFLQWLLDRIKRMEYGGAEAASNK